MVSRTKNSFCESLKNTHGFNFQAAVREVGGSLPEHAEREGNTDFWKLYQESNSS